MNYDYEIQFKHYMKNNFKKQNVILDVGTGINARHAIYLSEIFDIVYAMDRDRPEQKEKILNITKGYSNIRPVFWNIENFNFNVINDKIDVIIYCWPERPIWKSMIKKLLDLKNNNPNKCKIVITCLSGNNTNFSDFLPRIYFEAENNMIQNPDNKYLLNNSDLVKYLISNNVIINEWSSIYSDSRFDYNTKEILCNLKKETEIGEIKFPSVQKLGFYNRLILT